MSGGALPFPPAGTTKAGQAKTTFHIVWAGTARVRERKEEKGFSPSLLAPGSVIFQFMEAAKKQTRERGDGRGDSGGRRGREKAHAGGERGEGRGGRREPNNSWMAGRGIRRGKEVFLSKNQRNISYLSMKDEESVSSPLHFCRIPSQKGGMAAWVRVRKKREEGLEKRK